MRRKVRLHESSQFLQCGTSTAPRLFTSRRFSSSSGNIMNALRSSTFLQQLFLDDSPSRLRSAEQRERDLVFLRNALFELSSLASSASRNSNNATVMSSDVEALIAIAGRRLTQAELHQHLEGIDNQRIRPVSRSDLSVAAAPASWAEFCARSHIDVNNVYYEMTRRYLLGVNSAATRTEHTGVIFDLVRDISDKTATGSRNQYAAQFRHKQQHTEQQQKKQPAAVHQAPEVKSSKMSPAAAATMDRAQVCTNGPDAETVIGSHETKYENESLHNRCLAAVAAGLGIVVIASCACVASLLVVAIPLNMLVAVSAICWYVRETLWPGSLVPATGEEETQDQAAWSAGQTNAFAAAAVQPGASSAPRQSPPLFLASVLALGVVIGMSIGAEIARAFSSFLLLVATYARPSRVFMVARGF